MIIEEFGLPDLYRIRQNRITDMRGYFARTFCQDAFRKAGIEFSPFQNSDSYNEKKGTLRGLHFQLEPYAEAKIVRCVAGAIFDVAVDLRPDSAGYGQWRAATLSAENGDALFIPKGFAHGFQTLEAHSTVSYIIDTEYAPEYVAGIHWKDPDICIEWPDENLRIVSEKDALLPFLKNTSDR